MSGAFSQTPSQLNSHAYQKKYGNIQQQKQQVPRNMRGTRQSQDNRSQASKAASTFSKKSSVFSNASKRAPRERFNEELDK
jgi:hypothetical protein